MSKPFAMLTASISFGDRSSSANSCSGKRYSVPFTFPSAVPVFDAVTL